MGYADVVKHAKESTRIGSTKVPFADCELWRKGNQISLWTYWQGYQLDDIDDKGVDILLVGQDWGNPENKANEGVCKYIERIQAGERGLSYGPTQNPTDLRLARLFREFGDIDVNACNPGLRLFFTNYSLGYRAGSETGGMTKTIMKQDSELFKELVIAIQPKIIICLGKITYEMVAGYCVKDFCKQLKRGVPFNSLLMIDDCTIPVYGVAHPGSRGSSNVGGEENMCKAWKCIAAEFSAII